MSPAHGSALDNAIHNALLHRAMRCQPPVDGWQRIMAQIVGGCAGTNDPLRAINTYPNTMPQIETREVFPPSAGHWS